MRKGSHGAMAWLVLKESLVSFSGNRGFQSAATLAYYGFLTLMPMLLLAVFVLGLFVASSEKALEALAGTVRGLYPDFNEAILRDVAKVAGSKAWGAVSLVFLVWSMTPFAGAMRSAMLGIFKTDAKLHFVRAKLRDANAVFWLMLFFLFFALSRVFFGTVPSWLQWLGVVDWLVPPFVTAVVLAGLYRVFAPVKLPWKTLLLGGAAAALLLAVVRPVFGLVLRYNPGYGYAFGSLKAIFLLLVWVYNLFAAILLGAEVMANFHRRESLLLRRLFSAPAGKKLDALTERFASSFGNGEVLFREGDAGADMFYVASGEVELRKGDAVVKVAKAGEYFGELSLLLDSPRSASAMSRGESRVVVISRANFETIVRENPTIVFSLLKEMAQRLKVTTQNLAGGRQGP